MMKKNLMKKFASALAVAAMMTGMIGTGVHAEAASIDAGVPVAESDDSGISLHFTRSETKRFDGPVVQPTNLFKEKYDGNGAKVSYLNCRVGQAIVYIRNGSREVTHFIIPHSNTVLKYQYISPSKSPSATYTVGVDRNSEYTTASGYFMVDYTCE